MLANSKGLFPRTACFVALLAFAAATVQYAAGGLVFAAVAEESYSVSENDVEDTKAVFATVRTKDLTEARVRTPGTVIALKVDEGAEVKAGEVIAVVADPKIALGIKALDAQIVALESRVATAQADYDRGLQLAKRGVTPQARIDQLKTTLDVAVNELAATRAERQVSEAQTSEGEVLAPADGRVLKVPLTVGSVVMPGESVATIAANEFLLRIELPERHARFMKVGDAIKVGARGLSGDENQATEGRITQVYPQLESGRLVADAEVPRLSDYFVGERARVWISAGKRRAIVVPSAYVFQRFGLDFARLKKKDGKTIDVIVQLGRKASLGGRSSMSEVLAGLKAGDEIVKPVANYE
ncbi:MAG: efflux RND transporter periplasmic adaptor subunit [Alphaproteobacteria bacterium]|nr:efflux RND transporter periplasmic adaptor subunit [Alphaproteobacteria bacterium]